MININLEKCIACGLCAKDCLCNDIKIIDGKTYPLNKACINCGHCIAICPQNAVTIDNYDMKEVKEYNYNNFTIDPENLLNFIKFRRSIRHFNDRNIEKEKIRKIIEAGRYTATGGNRQPLSFIVIQQKMKELTDITVNVLYKHACSYELNEYDALSVTGRRYTTLWKLIYRQYQRGKDMLFFNAKAMIIVLCDERLSANSIVDGGLAASNMELMANALKLGVCFNGFFTYACDDVELRNYLYIPDNIKVVTSLLIGYTDNKYLRTVPRKKAEIQWM